MRNSAAGERNKLMKKLTAAERRYLDNATLIASLRLIFQSIEKSGVPIKALKEIATTTSGGTPNRQTPSYYGGSIPWIKSGELNNGLITEVNELITQEGLDNSSAKIYPKGTLVIALYGATVGKVGILDFDSASNQAVCAVTPTDKDIFKKYLFWFLRNKRQDFLETSFGGAQPNISQKILRQTNLPIPSPQLQTVISDFLDLIECRQSKESLADLPELPEPLSDIPRIVARIEELAGKVEEARELRSQSSQQANSLLQSRLKDFFEQSQAQNTPFKSIGSFTTYDRYGPRFYNESYSDIGIPIMRATDISDAGYIDYKTMPRMLVASGDKAKLTLKVGDLAVVRSGSVGLCAVFNRPDFDCIPAAYLIQFRFDDSVDPYYVRYCLQAPQVREKLSGRGTALKNVNALKIKSIQIPYIPLSQQRYMVAALDDLQSKINTLRTLQTQTATELNALLPAILDKAFKGEL